MYLLFCSSSDATLCYPVSGVDATLSYSISRGNINVSHEESYQSFLNETRNNHEHQKLLTTMFTLGEDTAHDLVRLPPPE